MKSIDLNSLRSLQRALFTWYRKHQRELQWRTTTEPYEILISEIMLQQTQVSRVREKLPAFLKRFPSLDALSRASKAEIILAWQGMGYNSRAVRLSNLAKIVTRKFNGRLPDNINSLQSLPGIGPYTAHALACFAYRQHVPVVDVNIRRVFSRVFWRMDSLMEVKPEPEMWRIAQRVIPRDAYSWNQSLMDVGATICTARRPLCTSCPLLRFCKSTHLKDLIHSETRGASNTRREPSRHGIPRRVWRGRVVETLRDLPGRRPISINLLRKTIRLRKNDVRWLGEILQQLRRDGLVRTTMRASQTYVSLAA